MNKLTHDVGWEVGTPVSEARPWLLIDYGSSSDQVWAQLPLAYEQRAAVASSLGGEGGTSLPSMKGLDVRSSALLLSWRDRSLMESCEDPLRLIL